MSFIKVIFLYERLCQKLTRLFYASSYINYKKHNNCTKTYYQLRQTSDVLCSEHGLSIITVNQNKGKSHYEWSRNQLENTIENYK
ncbi:hypothetical protein RI77_12950 [Listeria monocytogenes]|nr:hypothetical protein [Listeria monocytogenes]EAC7320926.1 hypothetical protein [Listeria monocytogenes]EAD0023190.1 hypothetical protein [Listeria monocytogenes]EAD5121085.1 hypothetical protein [Listeria monocytogenes]EAD5296164.1 hypothetical protein [Listeria monocytogenes]